MDIAAFPSVVAVRAHIPEDAFTASGLGTLREGSGVVIRDNGLVLTIGYLITEAEEVWLTTHDGKVVAGHALAYDQVTGFGLVQPLGELNVPALEMGDSSAAKLGDTVIFADGTGRSVRSAIVGKQEFAGYWEYLLDEAIFIAPAHPSWGGAALISTDGKLLGIGSLRLQMMRSGETMDINMAVPINLLNGIFDDLLKRGEANRPPRPWLGVFSAENNGEVIVMSVADGSPAAKAGLQPRRFLPQALDHRSGRRGSAAAAGARRARDLGADRFGGSQCVSEEAAAAVACSPPRRRGGWDN
jgi:S1-C subfamily serine protease